MNRSTLYWLGWPLTIDHQTHHIPLHKSLFPCSLKIFGIWYIYVHWYRRSPRPIPALPKLIMFWCIQSDINVLCNLWIWNLEGKFFYDYYQKKFTLTIKRIPGLNWITSTIFSSLSSLLPVLTPQSVSNTTYITQQAAASHQYYTTTESLRFQLFKC